LYDLTTGIPKHDVSPLTFSSLFVYLLCNGIHPHFNIFNSRPFSKQNLLTIYIISLPSYSVRHNVAISSAYTYSFSVINLINSTKGLTNLLNASVEKFIP